MGSVLYTALIDSVKLMTDIYFCGIPKRCRRCDKLKQCRNGFFKLRKCKNGCIEARQRWKLYHEDYLNSLVQFVESQEKLTIGRSSISSFAFGYEISEANPLRLRDLQGENNERHEATSKEK